MVGGMFLYGCDHHSRGPRGGHSSVPILYFKSYNSYPVRARTLYSVDRARQTADRASLCANQARPVSARPTSSSDCERASKQPPFNHHAPRIAPMMGLARELGAACRLSVARLRPSVRAAVETIMSDLGMGEDQAIVC